MGCTTSMPHPAGQWPTKSKDSGFSTPPKVDGQESQVSSAVRAGLELTSASNTPSRARAANSRAGALETLRQDGLLLEHMPELSKDREAVLLAVGQNGYAMAFAAPELQSDREFMLLAIRQNGWAYKFAAQDLKIDRELALLAVEQSASVMSFFEDRLLGDPEFIREAVRANGMSLLFAGQHRGSRTIVKEATSQNHMAMVFATKELREDREFVSQCVMVNGRVLQHAVKSQRADKALVLRAVVDDASAISFASAQLLNDRGFVLEALRHNGEVLVNLPSDIRKDREMVHVAVQQNGIALKAAPPELRGDRELVLDAVKSNAAAMFFADDSLRSDVNFAKEALRLNRHVLGFLNEDTRSLPEILAILRSGWDGLTGSKCNRSLSMSSWGTSSTRREKITNGSGGQRGDKLQQPASETLKVSRPVPLRSLLGVKSGPQSQSPSANHQHHHDDVSGWTASRSTQISSRAETRSYSAFSKGEWKSGSNLTLDATPHGGQHVGSTTSSRRLGSWSSIAELPVDV